MNLETLVKSFFDAGNKAAASSDAAELHAFRITAKRLRYTIEILDPEGGREWLKRLRRVQKELGEMNDSVVAAGFLRALPWRSSAAKPLPVLLEAEARAHIKAFRKTWQRSFGKRSEDAWRDWARKISP